MKKGQSAIEYLTTYGWMLIVIAIVGGSIFTTIQGRSQIESSGLTDSEVQVEKFGVTDDGLETELRAASSDQLENVNVSLIDQETGETVYSNQEIDMSVGDAKTIEFTNVEKSENKKTYGVEITYNTGGIDNLTVNGTIEGNIEIVDNSDSITGSAPTAPTNLQINS